MSNNQRDYRKELEGILDGLAESIEVATPEEILEDTVTAPSSRSTRIRGAVANDFLEDTN